MMYSLQNSIPQTVVTLLFEIDQMPLRNVRMSTNDTIMLCREQIRTTNRPLFDLIKKKLSKRKGFVARARLCRS